MKEEKTTQLRERMIEGMRIRGINETTQKGNIRAVTHAHHRFSPAVIQRAVWLYFRFPLSFRDIEGMQAERGINVSYETIRRWVLKFGPAIAATV